MIAYRKQSISVILRGLGAPKTRQPPIFKHARLIGGHVAYGRSMVRSLLRNKFQASCWVIENSRPYRDPNADIPKRVLMTRTSKVRIHFRTACGKFDN
jgi:hypothetical protein